MMSQFCVSDVSLFCASALALFEDARGKPSCSLWRSRWRGRALRIAPLTRWHEEHTRAVNQNNQTESSQEQIGVRRAPSR